MRRLGARTTSTSQTRRLRLRAEHLLPLACAGAIAMLAASEFMTTFKLNGGPGQTFDVQKASDQHSYALLVLAAFALIALVIAVANGSRPAAAAVAIAGVGALLLFLLIDLPDAGKVGTLDDARESFFEAKADPAAGFWVELAGALILAICGGALATLTPDQLRSFGPRRGRGPTRTKPAPAANPGERQTAEPNSGKGEAADSERTLERPRKASRVQGEP
ncbi:MAG: hypothetical protein AABM29_05550 [Actinomycetota bacterium]